MPATTEREGDSYTRTSLEAASEGRWRSQLLVIEVLVRYGHGECLYYKSVEEKSYTCL